MAVKGRGKGKLKSMHAVENENVPNTGNQAKRLIGVPK